MAQSVRVQDPYVLPSQSFSGEFSQRISLVPPPQTTASTPSKSPKSKKKAPPPKNTVIPKRFLTAAVGEREFGLVEGDHTAVTGSVQGSAVYLYDLARQQSLQSWSVPPGLLFCSPARFLPAKPVASDVAPATSEPAVATENGDDEPESHLQGDVYVAVHSGADVAAEDAKRIVWGWKAANGLETAMVGLAGKPHQSQKFAEPIFSLETFVAGRTANDGHVVLQHTQGGITVTDRNLKAVSSLSATLKKLSVVWSTTFATIQEGESGAADSWHAFNIVSVVQREGKSEYILRKHVITFSLAGGAQIALDWEKELPKFESLAKPIAFAYQSGREALIVALADHTLLVLDAKSSPSLTQTLSISFKFTKLTIPKTALFGGPRAVTLQVLNDDFVAVVGYRKVKSGVEELLTVWDTQYGAMHHERILNTPSESSEEDIEGSTNADRTFHVSALLSPISGPALVMSTTRLLSNSPLRFSSAATVVPFHCTALTLLAVLGKLRQAQLSNAVKAVGHTIDDDKAIHPLPLGMAAIGPRPVPENVPDIRAWSEELADLDTLDHSYLTRLLAPSISNDDFDVVFCEWIQKKLINLRKIRSETRRREAQIALEKAKALKLEKEQEKEKMEKRKELRSFKKKSQAQKEAKTAAKAVNGVASVNGGEKGSEQSEGSAEDDIKEEDDKMAVVKDEEDTVAQIEEEPLPAFLTQPPSLSLLGTLPIVELSSTVLLLLTRRCFGQLNKFWPRTVMTYLLRTGAVSTRSVEGGLVAVALKREDIQILLQILLRVPDLSETELAQAIRYICGAEDPRWKTKGASRTKKLNDWHKTNHHKKPRPSRPAPAVGTPHPERMRKAEWKVDAQKEQEEADAYLGVSVPAADSAESDDSGDEVEKGQAKAETSIVDVTVSNESNTYVCTPAQAKLLRTLFARPRTDALLIQAIRRDVSVKELGVLLAWISSVMDVKADEGELKGQDDRVALWWLWLNEEVQTRGVPKKGSVSEWVMAVDSLTILMDAHLSTLLQSHDLSPTLLHLHSLLQQDCTSYSHVSSKLRGALLPMHHHVQDRRNVNETGAEREFATNERGEKRELGGRWRRMVEDVRGQDYEVEIYKL
ncbi:hypothetical protein DFS34DRAFT_605711 [Phlyctochytrium arcticum]|nr:hypothetical protein DFS34DRAFT_605711 [Phlyctochytrium arcticum]